ncbi:MAG: ABA4-like family protein [Polyangiales bacterium]
MPLETLFKAANYAVLPFWTLLILAPRWSWTQRLVHGPVVLLLLTPIYAFMLFGYGPAPEDFNFNSLYGVMIGFSVPHIVTAGWIHYLIFDLFVGAWEVRDAQRRGVSHFLVVPCLIATLMVGPIGLLLYVTLRFISNRVLEYDEAGTL